MIDSGDALPLQKTDAIRTAMLHIDGKREARSGELVRFADRLLGDYEKMLVRLIEASLDHWQERAKRWKEQLADPALSDAKRERIRELLPALKKEVPRLAAELKTLREERNLHGLAALLSAISTTEAKKELVGYQEATFGAIAKCISSTVLWSGISAGEIDGGSKGLPRELLGLLKMLRRFRCDGVWKVGNTQYKPYLDAAGRYIAAFLLERYRAILENVGCDKVLDRELPVSTAVLASYAEVKALGPTSLEQAGADKLLRTLKPIQELYDYLIVLGIAP